MSTIALLDNPRTGKPRRRAGRKKTTTRRRKVTAKQRAAARRNIKKAHAARRRKAAPARRRRRTAAPKRKYGGRSKSYITRGPRKGQRRGRYTVKTVTRRGPRGGRTRVRKRYYLNPSSLMLMNPSRRMGFGKFLATFAGLSAVGFGGAIAARKLPSMVLGARDQGFLGYGANLGTAAILGLLVGRFMRMPDVGLAIALGGGVSSIMRIVNEKAPGSMLTVGTARFGTARFSGVNTWQYGARGGRPNHYSLRGSYLPRISGGGYGNAWGHQTAMGRADFACGGQGWV